MNEKYQVSSARRSVCQAETIRQWLGMIAAVLVGAAMMTEALARADASGLTRFDWNTNSNTATNAMQSSLREADNLHRDESDAVVRQ